MNLSAVQLQLEGLFSNPGARLEKIMVCTALRNMFLYLKSLATADRSTVIRIKQGQSQAKDLTKLWSACFDSLSRPPYYWANGETVPNFVKSLTVPSFDELSYQTAQRMKMGKYSFKSGITAIHFGKKYTSLPLTVAHSAVPSRLPLAVKYHAIAALE